MRRRESRNEGGCEIKYQDIAAEGHLLSDAIAPGLQKGREALSTRRVPASKAWNVG